MEVEEPKTAVGVTFLVVEGHKKCSRGCIFGVEGPKTAVGVEFLEVRAPKM